MSRGPQITEFERDFIRIGFAKNIQNATIARALGRTPAAVGQQIKMMKEKGTIENLPMVFIVDDVAESILKWAKRDGQ
ncbi:hypothetical protein [Planktotalea arctica]|uniref:hypothetical protein n=1 Tax=Planktotalea arctica TaxID=1481893 RepID=UPI003219DC25